MRLLFTYFFILTCLNSFSQDSTANITLDSVVTYTDDTIITISSGTFFTDSVLDTVYFTKYDTIIDAAKEYSGVRYQYGGMDHNGMDCSGLVCRAFERVNDRLPHSSKQLASMGEEVEADYLEKGDLIFFSGRSSNSISHVAIVSKIEDGLIYIVHATSSRGVIEEALQNNSYFMKRWLFNRRI